MWNISAGSVHIPLREVLSALASPEKGGIVWDIRLPRVLAAAILGGALSVSGFLLQTFFANPIAGPFVLGISSGAKLTVALVLVSFLSRGLVISSMAMVAGAFAGSMISMGFVLLMSRRVRNMSMLVVALLHTAESCQRNMDGVSARGRQGSGSEETWERFCAGVMGLGKRMGWGT